jgi:transcription antitermination factor NusG
MFSSGSVSQIEVPSVPLAPTAGFAKNDMIVARKWYAVSVFPRHEKLVARLLDARGTNYLLPLYSSLRRWKDRRKQIDMVLFPGYVFVSIGLEERVSILMLPGVARFVTFQGQPAVVPEHEIKTIGLSARSGLVIKPHPYLQKGRRVRIQSGPMAGVEGILVRRKDRFRVVLSVDLIMCSVAAEVDEADVEPLT